MSDFSFSLAGPEHLDMISALDRERFPQAPYARQTYEDALGDRRAVIIAASEKTAAVGFIFCFLAADEAEVYRLAVSAGKEGLGLGTGLLSRALDELRRRGARQAFLEVRKTNLRALRLYQKEGFVFYRERKGYYADGEDALCMRKGL